MGIGTWSLKTESAENTNGRKNVEEKSGSAGASLQLTIHGDYLLISIGAIYHAQHII